ncbi:MULTISPECIES: Spx/MgsR family RNA polymerase-binding regulatory protein [unclassified Enterococcus]|uniref:Spx/MgsR family RNA polymerase-binding regulatory protein n=1 Tax=unclassified Enterococcus TaxID=2608891 RepID=UPI0019066605|nr:MULTISPECIES: Spx/MgsR family RNA polymerase-binding regulatory protein [unclassified Enterococcus]MBK0036665.1 Spx/MgsR family RNA polymerase-binding regulatory protein [Enterococcus sp. S52]MBK0069328.1 Spx/MgsR family RNA polymerase-binding regulatory protein [Enterococcus sp. S53]MBK0139921.1 Spx/MgsR family RNA polymerase-binding regulatory protein [Enterococcus sp. S76]MBK0143620.1 Spx/MgsR family RNA polymerase-binding regulatory protein [Enterococcus sp. S77]
MIIVYYVSSNSSCRKAVEWLEEKKLSFVVRRVTKKSPISSFELKKILALTSNGFEDLYNSKSSQFLNFTASFDDYSTNQMIDLIITHPFIMKFPIIMDEKKLLVGFNEDDIRVFFSREQKKRLLRLIDC